MSRRHDLAYPGLTTPGEWTVLECRPQDSQVSVGAKYLAVPAMHLRQDMYTRMHELLHVEVNRIRTASGNPLLDEFRLQTDEITVESLGASRGLRAIYQARDHFDWTEWAEHKAPQQRVEAAIMWLQLAGSVPFTKNEDLKEYFALCHELLEYHDQVLVRKALASLQHDWSFTNCEKWAQVLTGHFSPKPPERTTPEREGQKAQEERQDAKEEEAEKERERTNQDLKTPDVDSNLERSLEKLPNGLIDLHRHTTGRQPTKAIVAGWLPSSSGTVLKFPRLLYPSGRIFGIRARGGSALIDGSVSNKWSAGEIEEGMKKIPGLWCAVYTAHSERRLPPHPIARMCIVASGGRLGSTKATREDEREHSGGNLGTGADAPCLQFMGAKAPPPHVWIGDGEVGNYHAHICNQILQKYNIVRVRTIGDAIEYLQGKAVLGWKHAASPSAYRTKIEEPPEFLRRS